MSRIIVNKVAPATVRHLVDALRQEPSTLKDAKLRVRTLDGEWDVGSVEIEWDDATMTQHLVINSDQQEG